MLHIEIDGKKLAVEEGAMVIEAADAAGIYIPRFCYHKKLSVAANCRMCLVEVERVAKPVPACATPVTEGMRVFTRSEKTTGAQKGVMEFLLINHPLDCPICDQGGECELQDLAVGYGRDVSRYQEAKRIVKDQDLGPFIATDMTRCIQCTRCVRFGQEIAGMMELGATGRGEHMRIGTYVESTVDSELSGNMIDICPVGALTSKPFRYSARSWELSEHASISPHDCVGANLIVETRRNKVMRVLPRENEEVNEVWLSDRDRFSYTALNGPDRLDAPMMKVGDTWKEIDWDVALDKVAEGLRQVVTDHGADALGALASPQITVEEGYLLQQLVRGLGSENVDHRLRGTDFRDDVGAPPFPWLGQRIEELEQKDAFLLIGSNIRKDQPLLGHRLRKAFLDGAKIGVINPIDFPFTFDVEDKVIVSPSRIPEALGRLVRAVAAHAHRELPPDVARFASDLHPGPVETRMADWLCAARHPSILLGPLAEHHPQAVLIRALGQCLSDLMKATLGHLPLGNSVGAWLAGVVPQRGPMGVSRAKPGRNAFAMLDGSLKGLLLMDAEPVRDSADGGRALAALQNAQFVVSLSAFRSEALDYAHIVLPLAPFTETAGTFVNAEGRWQSFEAAVDPRAEARPGWKILRVLAGRLGIAGCAVDSTDEIRTILKTATVEPKAHYVSLPLPPAPPAPAEFERIGVVALYDSDSIVRHSDVVHRSKDHGEAALYLNKREAEGRGLAAGGDARVTMGGVHLTLEVRIDGQVPDGAAFIPAALRTTALLPLSGALSVSRA